MNINQLNINKMKKVLFLCLIALSFSGCASLLPPTVTRHSSLDGYKYVYITPTTEKTSVTGGTFGGQYGIYGSTSTHSINPSDIISGHFLKRGYTRLPDIKPELANQTLIVNFGESGRRTVGLGYSIEVTIQLLSAKTNEVICVGVAEGKGETEADDVRIAIDRCMNEIFSNVKQ
jgi:hypothetical protein